jgi:predicted nucleic acid-binding protein
MLFLDTDILSYLLANHEAVINRVAAWQDGQPAITAITVYEILKGFRRSNTDILLAAIVMRNDGTLYTNNLRHFESIPHLKLLR